MASNDHITSRTRAFMCSRVVSGQDLVPTEAQSATNKATYHHR